MIMTLLFSASSAGNALARRNRLAITKTVENARSILLPVAIGAMLNFELGIASWMLVTEEIMLPTS